SLGALVAVWQRRRGGMVSSKIVDRLVRMRPWLSETRRADIDTAIRVASEGRAAGTNQTVGNPRRPGFAVRWCRGPKPVCARQTGAPLRTGLPAGEVGGRRPGCLGARRHDQGRGR